MIIRRVLVLAFGLGIIWDVVTTYLGTLIILGTQNFITTGIAVVGTAMVIALNFSTKAIWRSRGHRNGRSAPRSDMKRAAAPPEHPAWNRKSESFFVRWMTLRLAWILAVFYDLWTSLTCNALYVLLPDIPGRDGINLMQLFSRLTVGQALVVLFVTILTVISPNLFGHLSGLETDILD